MTRRNALKLFGAFIACLTGRTIVEASETKNGLVFFTDTWNQPTTYILSEAGIKEIIIEKKDGEKLVVPFSDIVEALSA